MALDNLHKKKNGVKWVNSESEATSVPIPKLLNHRVYALNKSNTKFVAVGLRPHSGFNPVIHIFGVKTEGVVFDEQEWKELVEQQVCLVKYFSTRELDVLPPKISQKTIKYQTIRGDKVLAIRDERGIEVFLGQSSVYELLDLVGLIDYRVEILKGLDFCQFYSSVIKGVADLPGDDRSTIQNVLVPVMQTHSENACGMLEMLKCGQDVINADLEMERLHAQIIKAAT